MSEHLAVAGERESTSAGTSGAAPPSAAQGMRASLRGTDFTTGERALIPVQRKVDPSKGGPGTAKPAGTTKPAGQDPKAGKTPDPNAPKKVDQKQIAQMAKDLGKAKSIVEANALIGGFLEMAVPAPGNSLSANLKIAIMVEGVYVGIKFDIGMERTDKGVELKGSEAVAVGVGVVGGAGVGGGKAYAAVQGTIGFKAKGDTVGECLNLVLLSIDQWLRNQTLTISDMAFSPVTSILRSSGGGAWVADALFGAGFSKEILKAMDPATAGEEADSIEYTEKLGLDMGADAGGGAGKLKVGAGAKGNVGYQQTNKIEKGSDGKLKKSEESAWTGNVGASIQIGPVHAGVDLAVEKKSGEPMNAELEVEVGFPYIDAVATYAQQIWNAYSLATGKASLGLGKVDIAKQFQAAAVTGTRATVVAALEAAQLASSAIKLKLSTEGKKRKLVLERTVTAGGDVKAGAGAGVAVEGEITTGTKFFQKDWVVA